MDGRLSETTVRGGTSKEQGREKRRMRERERRLSMSSVEREAHLARRRRNYQLRRQRAEIAQLDYQGSVEGAFGMAGAHILEDLAEISVPEIAASLDDGASVGIVSHKLPKLPIRSRLCDAHHHVQSADKNADDVLIAPDLRVNDASNSTCPILKGLRLNRVKQLARANSTQPNITVINDLALNSNADHGLPSGEFLSSSSLPEDLMADFIRNGDEQHCSGSGIDRFSKQDL